MVSRRGRLCIVTPGTNAARRWLVRKDRNEEARKALRRLNSAETDQRLDDTISMMRHTNEVEKEIEQGTSYLECFKGINLRRTEITCVTWVIQAASGASLTGYAAYFFEQAGLPTRCVPKLFATVSVC